MDDSETAATSAPESTQLIEQELLDRVRHEQAPQAAPPAKLPARRRERARAQGGSRSGERPAKKPPVDIESMVMSLAAKGLSNRQISNHLSEVHGQTIRPESVGRIADRVMDELAEWQTRPLDLVYPALFIDAMVVKIRGGKTANRPVHTAIGINVDGSRDILGLWIGESAEGAKYWHEVLTEIANRGVEDVCFLICDGLKGLPDAVNAVWPQAIVQTCVVHLLRNTYRYANRNDTHKLARDIRPIYTAANEQAAKERFTELKKTWGERYPAIIKLWENAWPEFVPFLSYSPDIREVIYTTNPIENLHSQLRRSVRAHGYFHNEQAALKCLYLTIRSFDPTGIGQLKWSNRWKPALNAFAITFEGRIEPN
jgi:putative transposase